MTKQEGKLKILFVGEIVGGAGIYCIKKLLRKIQQEFDIDLTIAAAEGATGGFGIGKGHAIYLKKMGVDVITTGDFAFYKRDMIAHLGRERYVLRPANYPYGNPGRGWMITPIRDSYNHQNSQNPSQNIARYPSPQVGIITLLGQSGFNRIHLRNPFEMVGQIVERIKRETPIIIVDFHATTTAEKVTMSSFLDGRVSAVIGSHVRTLSADARLLSRGTAAITHSGRTGSLHSVGGLEPKVEIRKFVNQVHEKSKDSWGVLELQAVIIEVQENGQTCSIETLRRQITKSEA